MSNSLLVKEETYPNGQKYLKFWMGKTLIGSANPIDGGYVVFGRRKPVATRQEAARQMISSRIKRAKAELNEWESLLKNLEG